MIRVLLIAEANLTREAFVQTLRADDMQMQVDAIPDIAHFDRFEEGLPDVVLLDINGKEITDPAVMTVIEAIHGRFASVPVIVISEKDATVGTVRAATLAGVRGYYPASVTMNLLGPAIRLVADGRISVMPETADGADGPRRGRPTR